MIMAKMLGSSGPPLWAALVGDLNQGDRIRTCDPKPALANWLRPVAKGNCTPRRRLGRNLPEEPERISVLAGKDAPVLGCLG